MCSRRSSYDNHRTKSRLLRSMMLSAEQDARSRGDPRGESGRAREGNRQKTQGEGQPTKQSFEADRLEQLHCYCCFCLRLIALVATPLLPVSSAGHPPHVVDRRQGRHVKRVVEHRATCLRDKDFPPSPRGLSVFLPACFRRGDAQDSGARGGVCCKQAISYQKLTRYLDPISGPALSVSWYHRGVAQTLRAREPPGRCAARAV